MDAIVPVPDAGPGHWLTGHTAQQGWPRPGKQGNAGNPRPVSARKASSGYRRLCRQCPGCQDSAARLGPLPRHNCHILCTGSEKGAEIRVIVWPVPAETCPPFAVKASDRLLGLVGENRSKGIRSSLSHPNGSESRLRSLQGQRFPGRTTGRRFAGRQGGLFRPSLHGDSVMSDARHAPGVPGASHASGDIPVNGPLEVPAVCTHGIPLRCWPRPAVHPSPVLVFFNFTTRKQHDKDIIGCRYQ